MLASAQDPTFTVPLPTLGLGLEVWGPWRAHLAWLLSPSHSSGWSLTYHKIFSDQPHSIPPPPNQERLHREGLQSRG